MVVGGMGMTDAERLEEIREDGPREVHMCGSFDCNCPTTGEFARFMWHLQQYHNEKARLMVEQLLGAVLGETS